MGKDNYKQKPMNVLELFIIRLNMGEGKISEQKNMPISISILWEQGNGGEKPQTQDKKFNNYNFTTYRCT